MTGLRVRILINVMIVLCRWDFYVDWLLYVAIDDLFDLYRLLNDFLYGFNDFNYLLFHDLYRDLNLLDAFSPFDFDLWLRLLPFGALDIKSMHSKPLALVGNDFLVVWDDPNRQDIEELSKAEVALIRSIEEPEQHDSNSVLDEHI